MKYKVRTPKPDIKQQDFFPSDPETIAGQHRYNIYTEGIDIHLADLTHSLI